MWYLPSTPNTLSSILSITNKMTYFICTLQIHLNKTCIEYMGHPLAEKHRDIMGINYDKMF